MVSGMIAWQPSMRELQTDTWQKLGTFKAQLKFVLEEVEQQVLGRGKDWKYILDFLLNRPTDSTFLRALNLAKKNLKRHLVCEVCEFIGQQGELLELLDEPVKLVLATADAFAKFGARASSGATSRILRQKTIEVAVFDEAQAYEIDQVVACVCVYQHHSHSSLRRRQEPYHCQELAPLDTSTMDFPRGRC